MGNQMTSLDWLPVPADERPDESLEFNHCQDLSVTFSVTPPTLHSSYWNYIYLYFSSGTWYGSVTKNGLKKARY